MAKKREIFKVDEDALKDMMASESISCGKSGADVGENVLPVTEKEKNVPEVKTQGQEKSRKTIRADPGLEGCASTLSKKAGTLMSSLRRGRIRASLQYMS